MFLKRRTSMFEQIHPKHLDYSLHYPHFRLIYGFYTSFLANFNSMIYLNNSRTIPKAELGFGTSDKSSNISSCDAFCRIAYSNFLEH